MRKTFASIQYPDKFAYAFDTEAWDHNAQVEDDFRQFETYGDGLTQHSGDWSITREYLPDYLASLATAMLADEELARSAGFKFLHCPRQNEIAFAASVVWKESDREFSKRRWYSKAQLKVSSSRSKEFDKRYEEIQEWNDGTPTAIYRMLVPEFAHDLDRYLWADAIRDWCQEDSKRPYMPLTAEFLKWNTGENSGRDFSLKLRYAFAACKHIAESVRHRDEAEIMLRNVRPPAPPEPATVEATDEAVESAG